MADTLMVEETIGNKADIQRMMIGIMRTGMKIVVTHTVYTTLIYLLHQMTSSMMHVPMMTEDRKP